MMQIVPVKTISTKVPILEGGKPVKTKTRYNGREVEIIAHDTLVLVADKPVKVDDKLGKQLVRDKLAKEFDPLLHGGDDEV